MIKRIRRYIKVLIYKLTKDKESLHNQRLEDLKDKGLIFGNNLRCFSDINGSEPYLIKIGDDVTISTDVRFITHDNSFSKITDLGTDIFGKITIGNNCFIGMGTIILPGVKLANNIIVGAGSVVTKSFTETGIVIAGNPAKRICTVKELYKKNINLVQDMRGLNFIKRKEYLEKLSQEYYIKR